MAGTAGYSIFKNPVNVDFQLLTGDFKKIALFWKIYFFHCVTELQNTKTFFDKGRQFGRLLESTLSVLLAVALIFLIFNLLFFCKRCQQKIQV